MTKKKDEKIPSEEIAPGLEIRDQRGTQYETLGAPWAWYLRVKDSRGKVLAEFGEGAPTKEEARCAGVGFYHGLYWGQRGVQSPMADEDYSKMPECFPGKPRLNEGIKNSPWLFIDRRFTYDYKPKE